MVESKHTPQFRIKIGETLQPLAARVASRVVEVVVDRTIDSADFARILLRNDDCGVTDSPDWKPGKRIEVELGYVDGGGFTRTFAGNISSVQAEFPRQGGSMARIHAYGAYHRFMHCRHIRSYKDVTVSDVASAIAAECTLSAEIEDVPGKREVIFQNNQTNLELLLELAEQVGCEVFVVERALHFRKPKLDASRVRTLKRGEELIELRARTSVSLLPTAVTVRSWNPGASPPAAVTFTTKDADAGPTMGGERPAIQVSTALGAAPAEVRTLVVRDEERARAAAVAALRRGTRDLVTAEAAVTGAADLLPGVVVELQDVGPVFGGTYYVTRVVHDYLPAGFATRLGLRRASIILPPAPAPAPEPPEAAPRRSEAVERARQAIEEEKESHFVDVRVFDPDGKPIVQDKARIVSDVAPPHDASLTSGGVRQDGVPAGQRRVVLPAFELPLDTPVGDPIPVERPIVPRLFDARWDRARARAGTPVKLRVSLEDVPVGTPVLFRIYRADALSPEDVAAFVEAPAGDKGTVEVEWTFRASEAGPDEPFRPARFYFLVQAGDARSRSGTIEFTDMIAIEARTRRGAPASGRRFRLRFPSGEELEGALDDSGRARFEDVPPGRYELVVL